MRFLGNVLATIVGLFIGVVLLFVIIMLFGLLASMGDGKLKIKENTFLELKFDEEIVDRTKPSLFDDLDLGIFKFPKKVGLNDILHNIEKAKNDKKISGIYLNVDIIRSNFGGWSTVEEIRKKLVEFKESGKPIYGYTKFNMSELAYYLMTVSDSIFMNPETFVELNGLGGTRTFYTKTAEKLGLKPQVIRVGKFKAATEPFFLEKMSEESREQTMKYINSIWQHALDEISAKRNISVELLNDMINKSPIQVSLKAKEKKLIDGIKYEDEVITFLREKTKVEEDKKPRLVSFSDYMNVASKKKNKAKDKIAVVYAEGSIDNSGSEESIGPDLVKALRKVKEKENIKAVVFRINSPGGSALVSDLIWREVDNLRKTKPVIASMGNVAASGGYYIACAADTIVASSSTITGSIGVFGLFFSGEKLYEDKMHLSFDEVKTNKHSNFMGGYPLGLPFSSREFSDEESAILQEYIDIIYVTFLNHVAQGRNMKYDDVHEIAQGRVWVGKDAKELGLVDEIGGLEKAIQIAKDKAGLDAYKIVEYPVHKDPFQEFVDNLMSKISEKMILKQLGSEYYYLKSIQKINDMEGIQARLPYDLKIQ